jgi:hypothetical protein
VKQANGDHPKGKEIADLWHAANKKGGSKSKSKDDSNSSASRRWSFSLPCTDMDFKQDVGVDTLIDSADCPQRFEYSKPFLPEWSITKVPSEMQRMHNWYLRACRLGLHTLCTPYHLQLFGLQGNGIIDVMFYF